MTADRRSINAGRECGVWVGYTGVIEAAGRYNLRGDFLDGH